jgi:hypothetical protein
MSILKYGRFQVHVKVAEVGACQEVTELVNV